MLVVPSKGWVCNGQCFGFYITSVSISPFGASVNMAVWSLVHSLGFVYQFSSDFYSMTAGGLLDMYLISCLAACDITRTPDLLTKYSRYIELILFIARPDGPLPLHDHQRPLSITPGNRIRHQQQQ
jgi:hypothetical protein